MGAHHVACTMNRRRSLCLAVLLASMQPRLAHAEDLKAVGFLFQFTLFAVFAFVMVIALLAIPIRLLVRRKRYSVQERWLWAGGWVAALALTATVLETALGSL